MELYTLYSSHLNQIKRARKSPDQLFLGADNQAKTHKGIWQNIWYNQFQIAKQTCQNFSNDTVARKWKTNENYLQNSEHICKEVDAKENQKSLS